MTSHYCWLLVIALAAISHQPIAAQPTVVVTNMEIRDAILSLVHSYADLENKLERHEQRDRTFDDQVRKSLIGMQKNLRTLEPLTGMIRRLEERTGSIETALLQQGDNIEKFTAQQAKVGQSLEGILHWLSDNAQTLTNAGGHETRDEDGESTSNKLDELTSSIRELRREIAELKNERDTTEETNRLLLEKTEKLVNSKLSSADEIIGKMEERLSQFYLTSPVIAPAQSSEFEEKVISRLDELGGAIKTGTVGSALTPSSMPDKQFIHGLVNETLEAINDMRLEVLTASDKSFTKTATRIKENNEVLQSSVDDILKTLTEETSNSEAFYTAAKKELASMDEAMSQLSVFLLKTGENVLDAKRGIDYGIHQIMREVSDVVKKSSSNLNATVSKRFDEIGVTILDNHNGALSNLSSKIETEISQVWRQIGIMYQEISSSKQALDRLQQQTETYVNGTLSTMDSMEGKVSLITGRMTEVDSNLNYLLGRLSLVTQEFNQIKVGLGKALDEIKGSFAEVQDRVKGPGPHKISSDEVESDFSNSYTKQ